MISQIFASVERDGKASLKRQRRWNRAQHVALAVEVGCAMVILACLLWEVYGR